MAGLGQQFDDTARIGLRPGTAVALGQHLPAERGFGRVEFPGRARDDDRRRVTIVGTNRGPKHSCAAAPCSRPQLGTAWCWWKREWPGNLPWWREVLR